MAQKSKIPNIIAGILLTISMASLACAVLPSIWFWIGVEVVAALLVSIGCAGEWYLHHHPAGKKKKEQDKHHNLESKFIGAVVIGVIMEFFSLSHAIPEAVKLERDIAVAQSNNLMMRMEVDRVEAQNKWRTISEEQKAAFIKATKDTLRFPIRVRISAHANAETASFAQRIRDVLDAAGFAETNADLGIRRWPEEYDILWTGVGSEMPPIVFLSNPSFPGKVVDLIDANEKIKTFASYKTNHVHPMEIVATNSDDDPRAFVTDCNGIPVLHIVYPDRRPFRSSGFISVQSAFSAIGIASASMTSTNIPNEAWEIFVNPK